MQVEAHKSDYQIEHLTQELEAVGIRLNSAPPDIYFKQKKGGGLAFNSTVKLTKVTQKLVQMVLADYKIFNAEVLFRGDYTIDQFIDVVVGNRIYMSCLYVFNKIDQISLEEVDRIARTKNSVVISCTDKLNLDYLKDCIWEGLNMIRVFTKKPGEKPNLADEEGIILRN